jgi:hypothetical protein
MLAREKARPLAIRWAPPPDPCGYQPAHAVTFTAPEWSGSLNLPSLPAIFGSALAALKWLRTAIEGPDLARAAESMGCSASDVEGLDPDGEAAPGAPGVKWHKRTAFGAVVGLYRYEVWAKRAVMVRYPCASDTPLPSAYLNDLSDRCPEIFARYATSGSGAATTFRAGVLAQFAKAAQLKITSDDKGVQWSTPDHGDVTTAHDGATAWEPFAVDRALLMDAIKAVVGGGSAKAMVRVAQAYDGWAYLVTRPDGNGPVAIVMGMRT